MVYKIAIRSLLIILIIWTTTFPKAHTNHATISQGDTDLDDRTLLNASNWGYWIYADGRSGIRPNGNSGGIYPRGTAGVIYQDGLMWGGKYGGDENDIRVGGGYYGSGAQAGWVEDNGQAISPNDDRAKIWRIHQDYKNIPEMDIREDAMELFELSYLGAVTNEMLTEVTDRYESDWENWPVDLGAPFNDLDQDGKYEPDADGDGIKWNSIRDETPDIANANQVVFAVFNDFDKAKATAVAGSDPLGLEVQMTAWTYANDKAKYGQIIFKKYKIINKSGVDITDMYLAQWSDPDIGYYGDDLVGCDTLRNMGFGYNGEANDNDFAAWGLSPAAVGYDLLQGPLVDGVAGEDRNNNGIDDANDYGQQNFKKIGPGKINLPMTAYGRYSAGNPVTDSLIGEYELTLQFYNMMKGFQPTDNIESPTPWRIGNINTNAITIFPNAGDPVTGIGDIDGQNNYGEPGDRRMMLSSGPFDLKAGESQEIVMAIVGGIGDDHLHSISEMRENDTVAQLMYDNKFNNVPHPPEQPPVTIKPFEDKILIDWGSDRTSAEILETKHYGDFKFEGYNVYQFSTDSGNDIEFYKIATYDKINGITDLMDEDFHEDNYYYRIANPYSYSQQSFYPENDNGLQRYMIIDRDYLTRNELYEGKTYYFGVTAYAYNPEPELTDSKVLVSPMTIFSVTPQEEKPGINYNATPGQLLPANAVAGNNTAVIEVMVIDPSVTTGHDYEIFFQNNEELVWNVRDLETNKVIVADQPIISSLEAANDQPLFDGLQVKVASPQNNSQISETDRYQFSTPAVEAGDEFAKATADKINVYPNPYYAHNDLSTDRFSHFVTFTHLPEKAVVRIFTLSGILVNTLHKDDPSQFLKWHLVNGNDMLVGSGIYIVHITLPDLNKTKVLKLCVIQKEQILEYF